MKGLVAAEPNPLQMQRFHQVVQLGYPLRHVVVVRVVRLEQEFEHAAGADAVEAATTSAPAEAGQGGAAVPDEPQPACLIGRNRPGSLEDDLDYLVVQIRRSDRHLSLLQPEHAKMVPRRLTEGDERN